jgi:hypothetical protein
MTHARRPHLRRVAALAVGLAVLPVAPTRVAAASGVTAPVEIEPSRRAKALQIDGQARYAQQEFEQAGDVWSRIFEVLPENPVNREERDTTLLITLDAYKEAYRVAREGAAADGLSRGVAMLRKGVGVLDRYVAAFGRQYGATTAISPSADAAAREIRQLLADAERELGQTKPATDPGLVGPVPTTLPLDERGPDRPSGTGLIAGGAVLLALGLAATSMIIIGAVRAKDAKGEYDDAEADMDQAGMDAADKKGARANGLIIGGSVATGVLLAAGGTLLGIGLRRRIRYQAFAPAFGPQYVGLRISGRF